MKKIRKSQLGANLLSGAYGDTWEQRKGTVLAQSNHSKADKSQLEFVCLVPSVGVGLCGPGASGREIGLKGSQPPLSANPSCHSGREGLCLWRVSPASLLQLTLPTKGKANTGKQQKAANSP